MPLMQIHYQQGVSGDVITELTMSLPRVVANALSCTEGGELQSSDIMIEVTKAGTLDTNIKDVGIRIFAHNYPSRSKNIDERRSAIQGEAKSHIPFKLSWYVWVILAPTSYASDTEPG